jgi:hypothetical protein
LLLAPPNEELRRTLGLVTNGFRPTPSESSEVAEGGGAPSGGNGSRAALSPDEERRLVLYGCLFLPWAGLVVGKEQLRAGTLGELSAAGHAAGHAGPRPTKTASAVRFLTAAGLKMSKADVDDICRVHEVSPPINTTTTEKQRDNLSMGDSESTGVRSQAPPTPLLSLVVLRF